MTAQEQYVDFQNQLRYLLFGEPEETNHLIYVLHGYGQLVHYFSKKFEGLDLTNKTLVFPEGLHRFYINGTSGRVGASWMTKEWREHDIKTNTAVLNKLHVELSAKLNPARISVLGFSQGGTTAARWVQDGLIPCDEFISWASVFPPDVPLSIENPLAGKSYFVLGDTDPYFPAETKDEIVEQHKKLGFNYVSFSGGHDIELSLVKKLLA